MSYDVIDEITVFPSKLRLVLTLAIDHNRHSQPGAASSAVTVVHLIRDSSTNRPILYLKVILKQTHRNTWNVNRKVRFTLGNLIPFWCWLALPFSLSLYSCHYSSAHCPVCVTNQLRCHCCSLYVLCSLCALCSLRTFRSLFRRSQVTVTT